MSNKRWFRQHTCVACGAQFRYPTQITLSEPSKRVASAQKSGETSGSSKNGQVRVHPCPTCGVIQPEMASQAQSGWHSTGCCLIFVIWGGVIFVGSISVLFYSERLHIFSIATFSICLFGFAAILSLIAVFYRPNRNLKSNLAKARKQIDSQQLVLTRPGDTSYAGVPKFDGPGLSDLLGVFFYALALIAFAIPLILPDRLGWHHNATTFPEYVGPGDNPTFYFDSTIESWNGHWNGQASIRLINADALGISVERFRCKTESRPYPNTLYRKRSSRRETYVWVQVEIPDLPSLEGKELDFEFKVNARFPWNPEFPNDKKSFEHRASVVLSSSGVGKIYFYSWLCGHIAGVVLYLVAVICFAAEKKSTSKLIEVVDCDPQDRHDPKPNDVRQDDGLDRANLEESQPPKDDENDRDSSS